MYLVILLALGAFGILVYSRSSSRSLKVDKAVEDLKDAKNKVTIHNIKQETKNILDSLKKEDK